MPIDVHIAMAGPHTKIVETGCVSVTVGDQHEDCFALAINSSHEFLHISRFARVINCVENIYILYSFHFYVILNSNNWLFDKQW